MSAPPILSVRGLRTTFATRHGMVTAVDGVDLEVLPGECLGVVGESGCGKSVTFASVMGLVKPPGRIAGGSIRFLDQELTTLDEARFRALRGRDMAMTMQDALTALNPAYTVADQIMEVVLEHDASLDGSARQRRAQARARALEMMDLVGIPSAAKRLDDYPHQFSGGMRQRIMIAIALACRPRLLIADEPTTALDVTIQAQVLDLISTLRTELGMSVVLITHDLAVVAEHCDRVVVMYAGQVVETAPTRALIDAPEHPYTRGLLASIPRLSALDAPLDPIDGRVPDLVDLPPGCRFRERCTVAEARCTSEVPMVPLAGERAVRCVLAEGGR
ncbi:MAG: ABC transporter ATP-binding protein [Ectothiorhodospiraceae bacterium]|nr:ABC transporter ATP-binding protein [Ectothiorhodospiraceae bacterium]